MERVLLLARTEMKKSMQTTGIESLEKKKIHLFDVNGTLLPYTEKTISDDVCDWMCEFASSHHVDIISGQPIHIIFEKIGRLADYIQTIYGHSGLEVLDKNNKYTPAPTIGWDKGLVKYLNTLEFPKSYQQTSIIIEHRFTNHREQLLRELSSKFPQYQFVRDNKNINITILEQGKESVMRFYDDCFVTAYVDAPEEHGYDHTLSLEVDELIHVIEPADFIEKYN